MRVGEPQGAGAMRRGRELGAGAPGGGEGGPGGRVLRGRE